MAKFKVTDTITLARTWTVEADSEDAAYNMVYSGEVEADSEEEIDNTPYEVEPLDDEDNE